MTEITSCLETIEPELRVMTRLFSFPETVWDPPAWFTPRVEETGGYYRVTFTDGGLTATRSVPVPDDPDPRLRALHRRRALRRLCKQTLYDLCRRLTGIHPPWGSMTGVRPTHLMLEALREGLSPEEAEARLIREFDVTPEKAALLKETALRQRGLPPPGDRVMGSEERLAGRATGCRCCPFALLYDPVQLLLLRLRRNRGRTSGRALYGRPAPGDGGLQPSAGGDRPGNPRRLCRRRHADGASAARL